jgi:DNA topoisomerase III
MKSNDKASGEGSGSGAFAGYQVGQVVHAVSARLDCKVTTPPKRYTQDTLLDAMVNAHRFGRTPAEREMLKQTEGLGTSRTRVPMMTSLIKRGLLETTKVGKGWQLRTSPAARAMLAQVPEDLRNVAMTARWEIALAGVREGKYKPEQVLAGGYKFVDEFIDKARQLKQGSGSGGRPVTGVAERGSLR